MTTYNIDATNQSLGRLATRIATLLRGKDRASYQPNLIPDVEVMVLNLTKAKFTGNKKNTKKYHRYSGYPGGLYTRTLQEAWSREPREVMRKVVYRMLPINRSRDKIISHLKFSAKGQDEGFRRKTSSGNRP